MTDTPQQFTLSNPAGEVIMTGSMSAIMERLPDTRARNEAVESMLKVAADAATAQETLEEAHASAVQMIADSVTRLSQRLDAYVARRDAQQRRNAEEAERKEQEEIEQYLDGLPDPDDPTSLLAMDPVEEVEDEDPDNPAEHHNTLDLAATQDQDLQGIIPPPEDPTGASLELEDELGGSVQTRPVVDPAELADPQEPPAQREPVSISLNEG
jgi:hypothetical protein